MAQILILILFITTAYAGDMFKVKSFQELRFEGVVPQKYEESCGASSLATLMNLYDENLTEESLLDDFNTTDMVNFEDLQKVANIHGYKAKGYKVTKEIIEKITIPIIARVIRHKDYPHFIVINNLQGDFFLSLDPTNGKRLMSKSEFYNIWFNDDGGYILIVIPDDLRNVNDIKQYHYLLNK
jgi:uncharacterized protein